MAYVASTVVVMANPPATRLLLFYCARADRRIRAAEAVVDACPGAPGKPGPCRELVYTVDRRGAAD